MTPFLIFLPGLGDDHRLFKYQTEAFPHSVAWDWIEPQPGETLENYAVRMTEHYSDCFPGEPNRFVVCGLSLGGMVAPYVARHLGALVCVRLCTVRDRSEFPRRYYPAWLLVRGCPPILWAFMVFVRLSCAFLLLFSSLWKRFADPDTLRAVVQSKIVTQVRLTRMMLDWAYSNPSGEKDQDDFLSIQVHGTSDPLIPIRCTRPDIRIEHGGHLLTLTHPEEINRILADQSNARIK